jgi:hypothetical protein
VIVLCSTVLATDNWCTFVVVIIASLLMIAGGARVKRF